MADFFCEDAKKFKIEELFERLLKFTEQLPALAKVIIKRIGLCIIDSNIGKCTTRTYGKEEGRKRTTES